mgnify:CR=1 FL=1
MSDMGFFEVFRVSKAVVLSPAHLLYCPFFNGLLTGMGRRRGIDEP